MSSLPPPRTRREPKHSLSSVFDWRPGKGGVRSPQIRGGGVKILNFRGSLNLALFYRDSKEIPQFEGQKFKLVEDNFRGKFSPPLAFGTFLPPLSRSPIRRAWEGRKVPTKKRLVRARAQKR